MNSINKIQTLFPCSGTVRVFINQGTLRYFISLELQKVSKNWLTCLLNDSILTDDFSAEDIKQFLVKDHNYTLQIEHHCTSYPLFPIVNAKFNGFEAAQGNTVVAHFQLMQENEDLAGLLSELTTAPHEYNSFYSSLFFNNDNTPA